MLFELLMAVFMEKHTPKSRRPTIGLPPSQSPMDATGAPVKGANRKGPSLNDARCANTGAPARASGYSPSMHAGVVALHIQ